MQYDSLNAIHCIKSVFKQITVFYKSILLRILQNKYQ